MLAGQAICKDCGNGTLNNLLNTQFAEDGACLKCGSFHVDGELYEAEVIDFDSTFLPELTDENEDPYSDEDFEKEVGA